MLDPLRWCRGNMRPLGVTGVTPPWSAEVRGGGSHPALLQGTKLGTITNHAASSRESAGAKLDRHESFVRTIDVRPQTKLAGPLEPESWIVVRVAHHHDHVVAQPTQLGEALLQQSCANALALLVGKYGQGREANGGHLARGSFDRDG